MRTEKLNYDLPGELIAQKPTDIRSASRLLVLDRANERLTDSGFSQLGQFLKPGDCLVLNNTRVLPAKFGAQRQTGAKLEGLFLRLNERGDWLVLLKGAGKVKISENIYLCNRDGSTYCQARLIEKLSEGKCILQVDSDDDAESVLEEIGFVPLPPYIKRGDHNDTDADKLRYQTVYAQRSGAVAAPTAGLHFTNELIEQLKAQGVRFAHVTLHVGYGTFKPVTAENLEDHEIGAEWFEVDRENAELINSVKQNGGRIIAVGTTSVRTLETIANNGQIQPSEGVTGLFITPGYKFKIVDAMLTNFHLPKSTLLALISAFAGFDTIMDAYRHAVEQQYRFYSYGDAMLII
ncbi:MAG: tRNA preQ1(34) S-adenosylmethionine ribosyltransferase-isomerase QueA [Planctomycetota bacterium]|jgi:S-adenosylmethionine:tRNA ribosyltransferase-isomerase